jgi:hypothetical protein
MQTLLDFALREEHSHVIGGVVDELLNIELKLDRNSLLQFSQNLRVLNPLIEK